MAGAFIQVEIDTADFQHKLNDLAARGKTFEPALKRIGQILTRSVRENFLAEGRPSRWKPLAQSTLWAMAGGEAGHTKRGAPRMKKGAQARLSMHRILSGSAMAGGLMGTIHYETDPNQVRVGTDKAYGAIHQFGGTIPPATIKPRRAKALFWPGALYPVKEVHRPAVHIPARPYLVVQDEDRESIQRTMANYLAEALS